MKEANYSNGDYYHYTYDAVGNRLSQTASIGGQVSTTNYVYDDANRLTSVNGVNYTWDNNGNLLNDGVNAYTYDSANRLKTFSGQGNNVTYAYNGLGDRLRETVDGNPTTFTMDLNPSTSLRAGSGLTQALSDGTNSYIYGNGRIAQAAGTSMEYFLGDALGSVRQLTNGSGAITYAKAYDPYGVVTMANGASSTAYGYTGEYTSNDMVYLRARMYDPTSGRFTTKDSWQGEYNRPLSLNRWMYVEGNPVNQIDPSGQHGAPPNCSWADPIQNINYVNTHVNLPKGEWINTYTAAGIAVQCWADAPVVEKYKKSKKTYQEDYAGIGPAQVTNKWISTPYGEWIEDSAYPRDISQSRGYGLRCYIPVAYLKFPKEVQIELAKSCSFCFLTAQIPGITNFDQNFALEPIYDQRDINAATVYMKRMILLIVNACKARSGGCGDTDIYIAAALAQNGPGFTVFSMKESQLQTLPITKQTKDVKLDWVSWFEHGDPLDTSTQLWRFDRAIQGLRAKNWTVPYIDTITVGNLINTH